MTKLSALNHTTLSAVREQLRAYGQHLLEGGNTAIWSEVLELKDANRVDEVLIVLFLAYVAYPLRKEDVQINETKPEFEAFAQIIHACLHELLVHYRDGRDFAIKAWARIEAMLVQVLLKLQTTEAHQTEILDEPLRDFLLIATDTGFQFAQNLRDEIRQWMEMVLDDTATGHIPDKLWKWHDPFLSMLNQVSEGRNGVDEFDCYDNIENQMTFLSAITTADVFAHGLSFERSEINEIIPLMALHSCEEVALAALEVLETCIESLSALGLKRLVIIRNWLPSTRHTALDRVIRLGRKHYASQLQDTYSNTANVKIVRHLASTVDGSGAQNIMTLIKSQFGFKAFVGVVKERIGWVDVWSCGWTKRVECERIFRSFQQSVYTLDVTQDYVEFIFRQGLAWNITSGIVPKPTFLHWIELVNDTQVNPRGYDYDDMCYLLDLDADTKPSHFQIRAALENSSNWLRRGEFAVGWFEVGDHVEAFLENQFLDEADQILELCLRSVFEPLRDKWSQRFLRMAYWTHCNAKRKGPKMMDFFAIAFLINDDLPLEHIPFMRDLALATLGAYATDPVSSP